MLPNAVKQFSPYNIKWALMTMDHCVFRFATRGQCLKGKKLDCFEHNHVFRFKLQCASIVILFALPSGGNRKTQWSIVFYTVEQGQIRLL